MADQTYGSEVQPNPPTQTMTDYDPLAGQFDADRDSAPSSFSGGTAGSGLGGTAEGTATSPSQSAGM